jgi:hypothetical protein
MAANADHKGTMDLFYQSIMLLSQWRGNPVQMVDQEYIPVMHGFFKHGSGEQQPVGSI